MVVVGTALIFFASQFAAVIIVVIALVIAGKSESQVQDVLSESNLHQLLIVFLVGVFLVWTVQYVLHKLKLPARQLLLLRNKPTLQTIGEVIVVYGVYFVTTVIVSTLLQSHTAINVEQSQELGITTPEDLPQKIIIFVMLVVLPPIYEEIMFRGFLYQMLRKYVPIAVSAVLTCILFGVAHLEYGNLNWIAAIDTLIFSAYLIYISQRHKSLYSAILLHAMKNAVAFSVLFVW